MSRRPKPYGPLLVGTIGLVFFCVGLGLSLTDAPRREFESLSRMRVVSPTTFASGAVGETVFLEGRVGDEPMAGPDGFVAYVRSHWRRGRDPGMTDSEWERARREGRDGHWVDYETRTPRLSIGDADRSVRFVDGDYDFGPAKSVGRIPSTDRSPADRIEGVRVGDRVVVLGRVARDSEAPSSGGGRAIDAHTVCLGTAAAYVAESKSAIGVVRLLGGIFLAVGAVVLLVAGILGRLWWKAVRVARSRGFAHKPRGHDA